MFSPDDHGWEPVCVLIPRTDINGNRIAGNIMVRRVRGERYYRPETEAEQLARIALDG